MKLKLKFLFSSLIFESHFWFFYLFVVLYFQFSWLDNENRAPKSVQLLTIVLLCIEFWFDVHVWASDEANFGLEELIRKMFFSSSARIFLWLFKWWTPKKEVKLILSFTRAQKKGSGVGVWRLLRYSISKLQNEQLFVFFLSFCWSTANDKHSKALSRLWMKFYDFFQRFFSSSAVRWSLSQLARSRPTKPKSQYFLW